MLNKKKTYIGSRQIEIEAAKLYDKAAIMTFGLKVKFLRVTVQAKTNFDYSKKEIL